MTQAYLHSFIVHYNQTSKDRQYPTKVNRLSKIQASALYIELNSALQHTPNSQQRLALLRAWQELRELGYDTDLLPQE